MVKFIIQIDSNGTLTFYGKGGKLITSESRLNEMAFDTTEEAWEEYDTWSDETKIAMGAELDGHNVLCAIC